MTAPAGTGWSLQRRLLRRVVAGVGLGWLLGLGIGMFSIAHEMGELLDQTLADSARSAMGLYRLWRVEGLPAGEVGGAIRILDHGVEVIAADWPALSQDGGQKIGDWRVHRLSDPASGVIVEVGQRNQWLRDELLESIGSMLFLMLPVLMITIFVVRRATTSALRPAMRFAGALQSRKATDLSPVAATSLPREMAPIPDALNGYLQRLRNQIEAERLFATNAAHELRTPIAAASAQAQLLASGMADPGAPQRMTAAMDRLTLLVERLLQLSRAEAGIAGDASCDIVQTVRILIANTCPEAVFDDSDQDRVIVPVHHDAAALIIANLLRNARDHGAGEIRVRLDSESGPDSGPESGPDSGPRLTISNAVAPNASFRHGVFERSASSRGTGLGLSIVAKMAEKEAIGLRFALRDGRAEVELRFPAGE